MSTYAGHKRPGDAIGSLNSIHRGVGRIGVCVSLGVVCLYLKQYVAAVIAGISVMSFWLGRSGYLFRNFWWFRRWIGWLMLANVAACILMLLTQTIWWIVGPFVFIQFSNSMYERELRELGREHDIPQELPRH